jgi:hypothetical protein
MKDYNVQNTLAHVLIPNTLCYVYSISGLFYDDFRQPDGAWSALEQHRRGWQQYDSQYYVRTFRQPSE